MASARLKHLLRPALLLAGLFIAACAPVARAEDQRRIIVAAAGPQDVRPPYRQKTTLPFDAMDVWHLAQNTTHMEASSDAGTILVALKPTAPDDTDAELALQHGIEIANHMVVRTLNLRIVSYRVPKTRDLGVLLERLRKDPRVSSVQTNVVYQTPVPGAPEARVSAREEQRPARTPPRALASRRAPRSAMAPKADAQQPGRVAAADILAGGL